MVDDIRPPRTNKDEEQNKYPNFDTSKAPQVEAPHLYEQEEGFVAAKAALKLKKRRLGGVRFRHATRKQQILGVFLVLVLLIGGGSGVYAWNKQLNKREPTPAPNVEKKEEPPKSNTEASKLTGVQVNPEVNKRPVVSIQIENSPDARPQSGLKDAGVVFEAIAEGGITRFNASFLETQPDYIGPVRSVRPYYASLAAAFDPVFVHAGGSAAGLAKLRELGLKDLDHGANGNAFRRVSERYAPHNLYTSMADLDRVSASRGYTTSNIKSFARKEEKKGLPTTAKAIDLKISSALYNVHYDFDPASNTYKRSMGGRPHTDQRSGQQLSPKAVVVLVSNY